MLLSIVPDNQNLLMYAFQQGLSFGVGLLVMLYDVRMLINQIIPAFQGISEKLIPNAIPAFDLPYIILTTNLMRLLLVFCGWYD